MSAVAAPYGLRPIGRVDGLPYAGATRRLKIASGYNTAIGNGDIVQIHTDGTVTKVTTLGTAASAFPVGTIGVFVGCEYTSPTLKYKLNDHQWRAGTVADDAYAFVVDDPNVAFQVQANGSVGQALLHTNMGVVQGAVNTASGNSTVRLDTATSGTANTIGFKVIDFVYSDQSAPGDAFTDVIVKFNPNSHAYTNGTGVA